MKDHVNIIQIDFPNKIRNAVPVHTNVANNLILNQKYTEQRKCGYLLEEDFNNNYKIIKEDERQTNSITQGVDTNDNRGTIDESNNDSGNGTQVSGEPERKRSPRKLKG